MPQQIALKLTVAEDRHGALQRHPLLASATRRELQTLVSVYYDTGRLALRRAGLLLRLRRDGASWIQTVKRQDTSGGGLTVRPEWQAPYLNHFDFSHIDDSELRDWLRQEGIAGRIASIFETSFRRRSWVVEPGPGIRVLAKLDRGWIAADGRREVISELELQLLSGSIEDIYALALVLGRNLSLPPQLLSKAERGYRLFRKTAPLPVRASEVNLGDLDTPLAAFRRIALECLSHLQANHPGAIASDDPEYVHQMRVATRRLRAAIRLFRPALPPELEGLLVGPLRGLMRSLGQARDLDVLVTEIVAPVSRAIADDPRLADLAGAITNRQYAARDAIRQQLRQPAYGTLLLTAGQLLHRAPFIDVPRPDDAADALIPFADRRLRRLLRRIHELVETARVDYPPTLHELRIAIKRLRYAIEFFGAIIPGKAGISVVKRLAGLQEELGQLNDLASAGNLLMICAGRAPHLREAVTLVGGWHGQRYATLLAAIPDRLESARRLKLPRLRAAKAG